MKKKILLVVSVLFGLMFINAGLNKIFQYIPVPPNLPDNVVKVMGGFMAIGWLMPLVAIVEIVGGVLVAVPKLRALGSIVLFPIMMGILVHHIFVAPEGLPIAIIMFGIHVWFIFENREKYLPMIK